MTFLLDTSVLVRLASLTDAEHFSASNAVSLLLHAGETLHITPQNLIEFRNVATRPKKVNGLGFTAVEADRLSSNFESKFPLLPDTPAIYPAWKSIVQALGVIGKQVHDARLIAVCQVHHVTHLLTFNVAHFTRLAMAATTLAVLDPRTV